ncbi:DUF3179 domain-containing protein [Halorubellus sp. JP-L1]|uniref:DUF3179 domain-containing (seleno)protein n=1 Tax=Halorubellus sp. JP-L1 TaxID=2715753 RepID=UPI00140C6FEE|nr:DUF3179 domain-containing (seleno)protein [Halorubellus sp. JP-L1]NHN42555.1 DUF3179 domain-containing protein [Halorubellus sp. JP-L1]
MNVIDVLPRDAIPSVDDPTYEPVAEYANDRDDEVVVVDSVASATRRADGTASGGSVDGDPVRAYPVRYLHYHEICNAEVDGRAIAVTWCPLCGSAVVYDRTVETPDGERVLEFGVSGTLADDDLVMYDRETDSEWKQSAGVAISGALEGTELDVLPAAMTTVGAFADANPDGEVLVAPGGESEAASDTDDPAAIDYDATPYESYFEMDGFGLAAHRGTGDERDWEREDLDPKTVVIGVERDGDALGFALDRLEANGSVAHATVGDADVVAFATPDGVHAYENPGFGFDRTAEPGTYRADGARWKGATGKSDDARELERLPARRLFAFAWQDDHGPDAFWTAG